MSSNKKCINVRVTDDTLTELHKLAGLSPTVSFVDVAGELLDKAAMPNVYLISLAPSVIEYFKREALSTGIPIELHMTTTMVTGAKVAMMNTEKEKVKGVDVMQNTHLITVPPDVYEVYKREAWNTGLSPEQWMTTAIATFFTTPIEVSRAALEKTKAVGG